MHVLPPAGHPARELFDVADLVAVAQRERDPVCMMQARGIARRMFADNAAIRRVAFIVLRANDQLELVSYGRRLGHRVEWKFEGGLNPRRAA